MERYYDSDIDPYMLEHYFILLDNKYILSSFNKTKYEGYGWIPIEFYDENVLYKNLHNELYRRTDIINICVEQFPKVDKYNDYENIKYHYEKCGEYKLKILEENKKLYTSWMFGEVDETIKPPKFIIIDVFLSLQFHHL